MTRSNLAVCFGPVIFSLSCGNDKKKIKAASKMMAAAAAASRPLISTNHPLLSPPSPSIAPTHNQPTPVSIPSTSVLLNPINTDDQHNTQTTEHQQQHLEKYTEPPPAHTNPSSSFYSSPATLAPHSSSSMSAFRKLSEQIGAKIRNDNLLAHDSSTKRVSMFEPVPNSSGARTSSEAAGRSLLAVPNSPLQEKSSTPIAMTTSQMEQQKSSGKSNYKQKLTSAANSIVNFASGESSSTATAAISKESMDSLERLSKVSQMCVNDMIKYSMDLFTVKKKKTIKISIN